MVVRFSFGLVQMTYLRPPLNLPAEVHAFSYPTCHCTAKVGQNILRFLEF